MEIRAWWIEALNQGESVDSLQEVFSRTRVSQEIIKLQHDEEHTRLGSLTNRQLLEELRSLEIISKGQGYPAGGLPAWMQWRRAVIVELLEDREVPITA